jgi:hypothetical protein
VCIDARADLTGPQTQSEKAKTDNGAEGNGSSVHTKRPVLDTRCRVQFETFQYNLVLW